MTNNFDILTNKQEKEIIPEKKMLVHAKYQVWFQETLGFLETQATCKSRA